MRAWLGVTLAAGLTAAVLVTAGAANAAGETIRVEDSSSLTSNDPLDTSPDTSTQIVNLTCARLYTYPDVSGPGGYVAQPEIAAALPTVSADGLTVTIDLRPGFGFSSAADEQVTAETFVRVIQRWQGPSGGGLTFDASEIASATTNGDYQLVLTLTRPVPNLVEQLTAQAFCAVPSDVPVDSLMTTPTEPTAGPYYIASVSTSPQEFVLKQNPNYGGTRIRNLGEIDWYLSVPPATAVADVQAGTADYAPSIGGGSVDFSALDTQYGSGSQAAADGHQQFFWSPQSWTSFVDLNNTPGMAFSDYDTQGNFRPNAEKLRQAIAYAIDRNAFAAADTRGHGAPTDQILPPGFPGFQDWSVHSFTADPIAAMSLALEAGVTPDTPITIQVDISSPGAGGVSTSNLKSLLQQELTPLGINLNFNELTLANYFGTIATQGSSFDLAYFAWLADYADPYDFLNLLFDGNTIQPNNNTNLAYYNDPTFNTRLDQAAALDPGSLRNSTYADLDRDLSTAAPMVPVFNNTHPDFFSARIGCQVSQPLFGVNVNDLCVRVGASESAGGTLSTGSTASTDAPLQTAVTTPNAGQVSIQQGVATDTVTNYRLLQQQLTIAAPNATAAVPLQLAFTLDSSLVGATDPSTIDAIRDGVPVPACIDSSGQANPDPCLASRTTLAGGDLQLVVLSSHASLWNFGVIVDDLPPVLVVPASFAVNATGPAGVVVTYTASATDNVDGAVSPTCSTPSGSLFPTGDTVVTCSAVDAHHNLSAPQSFTVHVKGAAEQLGDLLQTVVQRKLGPGFSLPNKLRALLALVATNHKPAFCVAMKALDLEVRAQAGKKLTAADATALRAGIARIESVEGC